MNEQEWIRVETGIYYNTRIGIYRVIYSQRDPVTRQSRSLRRYRDRNGNKICDMVHARTVRAELKEEVVERIEGLQNPSWRITVLKMVSEMREENYEKRTVDNYEMCLRKNTFKVWRSKNIQDVTSKDIKTLFRRNRDYWSDHHKKNMRKYLGRVFSYAIEEGLIKSSPMPRSDLKAPQRIQTFLNQAEMKELLVQARRRNHPWFPVWMVALSTGMRQAELKGLKWTDVDFVNNLINVKRSMNRVGKLVPTKSGKERTVDMSTALVSFLKSYKLESGEKIFVLPRLEAWEKGYQAKILKDFQREIGLPETRFHDLRASAATAMLMAGVPALKIMVMFGWEKTATLDIYARKAGAMVKGIAKSLDFLDVQEQEFKLLKFTNNGEKV